MKFCSFFTVPGDILTIVFLNMSTYILVILQKEVKLGHLRYVLVYQVTFNKTHCVVGSSWVPKINVV